MKVLKPDFENPDWTMTVECRTQPREGWSDRLFTTTNHNRGCGAILEVSKADLFFTVDSKNMRTNDQVEFICMVCGTKGSAGSEQLFNFKRPLNKRKDSREEE